jgi:hypothetical protein
MKNGWITIAAVACSAVVVVLSLRAYAQSRRSYDLLLQDHEATKARLENQLVAERVAAKVLNQKYSALAAIDEDLRGQLKRTKNVAKVSVERLARLQSETAKIGPVDEAGRIPEGQVAECRLKDGDDVRFRVVVVDLRSKYGNLFVNGNVALDKVLPDRTEEIAKAPFDSRLSSVVELGNGTGPERIPSWSMRAGALWSRLNPEPTGAYLGVDRRVFRRWWVSSQAMHDIHRGPSVGAGIRWDVR